MHALDALKHAGLQGTASQVTILDYLHRAGHGHFSAEEIHRRISATGDRLNLSTTYRVLNQLQAAGLVASVALGKHHTLYELDTGKMHDHLVCVVCGRVEEFSDPVIDRRRNAIAKKFGLRFLGRALALQGTCADCAKRTQRFKARERG
jgi:Fur family ferric uptake transcriptional regulator